MVNKSILFFTQNPRILFLLDALGALITATLLYFVLQPFHETFGIPANILSYLSLSGLVLCVYSLSCFLFLKANWKSFLRVIAIGNLLYCLATSILLILFFNQLTVLGLLYFLIEICIILFVVILEIKTANYFKH